jgi:hypothetical protein
VKASDAAFTASPTPVTCKYRTFQLRGCSLNSSRERLILIDRFRTEIDAWGKGPARHEDMAQIYVLVGEHDEAID